MERTVLLLGDPRLYEASVPVRREELPDIESVLADLHDTLMAYRKKYGAGRAIAAPQIGAMKRLIYMHIDRPVAMVNPVLEFSGPGSDEMMEVLDDCMSFPGLYVRVLRHRRCRIRFLDTTWTEQSMDLEGDLSELIQHEYDHLDGILATMRAVDSRSLVMKFPPAPQAG
ncbi:peptide deformylase [Breznakiella homolactica]|uniref:Peptide deformylase n=1 Tax=Breznakiella homolactica TaxID=2798577 RepID=A0A7T7XMX6_9SPIR|nr:peptide deformylase [Breznakiella homolactica]QQO09309.1 peptide deformylase [Breznakiella homolactica]